MNTGRFARAVIGVWTVRVALNATFYTQIAGRQFEQISSAHPGMFEPSSLRTSSPTSFSRLFLAASSLRLVPH